MEGRRHHLPEDFICQSKCFWLFLIKRRETDSRTGLLEAEPYKLRVSLLERFQVLHEDEEEFLNQHIDLRFRRVLRQNLERTESLFVLEPQIKLQVQRF